MIPSPTLPMQEQLDFIVSEFLSSDNTNQQIHGMMLSLEQTSTWAASSAQQEKNPNQDQTTTKHQAAVTLAEDTHCKLCTDSQGSEMFDRRTQVSSIASSAFPGQSWNHSCTQCKHRSLKGILIYLLLKEASQIQVPFQVQVSTFTSVPWETRKRRKWLKKQLCTFYCLNRIPIRAIWRKLFLFGVLFASNQVRKEI